jgi:hypothetical protein
VSEPEDLSPKSKDISVDLPRVSFLRIIFRITGSIIGALLGGVVGYVCAQKIAGAGPIDVGYVLFGAAVGAVVGFIFFIAAVAFFLESL